MVVKLELSIWVEVAPIVVLFDIDSTDQTWYVVTEHVSRYSVVVLKEANSPVEFTNQPTDRLLLR